MYLEIGPRQVGKTTRLAEAVAEHLSTTDDKVLVLVVNLRLGAVIKKLVGNIRPYTLMSSWYRRDVPKKCKLFVDDFDYLIPSMRANLLRKEFTEMLRNGYLTTTPREIRNLEDLYKKDTTDLMARLLQLNGHKYNIHAQHFVRDQRLPRRNIVVDAGMGRGRNELFGAFAE